MPDPNNENDVRELGRLEGVRQAKINLAEAEGAVLLALRAGHIGTLTMIFAYLNAMNEAREATMHPTGT